MWIENGDQWKQRATLGSAEWKVTVKEKIKQLLKRKHGTRIITFALLLTMLAWLDPINIGVAKAAEDDAKSPIIGVNDTEGTKPMIPSTPSTNPTVGATVPMEPTGNNPTSPTQTNPGDMTDENTQKISVTGGYLLFDKTTGTILR